MFFLPSSDCSMQDSHEQESELAAPFPIKCFWCPSTDNLKPPAVDALSALSWSMLCACCAAYTCDAIFFILASFFKLCWTWFLTGSIICALVRTSLLRWTILVYCRVGSFFVRVNHVSCNPVWSCVLSTKLSAVSLFISSAKTWSFVCHTKYFNERAPLLFEFKYQCFSHSSFWPVNICSLLDSSSGDTQVSVVIFTLSI